MPTKQLTEFSQGFLHGIGYFALWLVGLVVVPMVVMIIYGHASKFSDTDIAQIVFWTTFMIYIILTAIFLISI